MEQQKYQSLVIIGHICHPASFHFKILCKERCGTFRHLGTYPHNAISTLEPQHVYHWLSNPGPVVLCWSTKFPVFTSVRGIRRNCGVTLVLPCSKPSESSFLRRFGKFLPAWTPNSQKKMCYQGKEQCNLCKKLKTKSIVVFFVVWVKLVALKIKGKYEKEIGTLQWYSAMAPRRLPQSWSSPVPPSHITLEWHPAMAPSSTQQWHHLHRLVPRPIRQSGSSPSPIGSKNP